MVTEQDFEQSNQVLNDKITTVQNDLGKQILDLTNEMGETFTRIESRFTDLNTHNSPKDRDHRHPSSSNIGLRASASRVLPLHRHSQTFRPKSDNEPDEYRPPRHAFRGLPTEDHDIRRPRNLLPCRNVDLYRNPYDDRRDSQRRSSDNHFDPARKVKVDAPEFDGRLDANVFLDWLAAMDDYFEWCNIKEEPNVTVARFLNGLKFEVKRVVSIHNPETLEDAYSKALEAEKYLRPYPFRCPPGDLHQTRPSPSEGSQSFNYRRVNTSTSNAHFDSRPPISRDRPVLPSHVRPHNPNIECHHYHAKGHITSRCPQRTLIIGQEYNDYYPHDPTDEVVEPIEDIYDLDLEADLDDREFKGQLHMMRCIFTKPVSADIWKRTNVFHTFIQYKGKSCKLVIDRGSTMNIVSNAAVTKFQLNPELHPHPFRVAWVDKTYLPITHRCLVPLSLGSYSETIYCDILPMEIAHILLRRP
ncbi:hypothetical protein LWI28_015068 [Acer negundo]|uniref:Uncharacterized protein n=1 Tax=Acer negundo TaxID=4023 RepID=A0AAD5NXF0_ACENE|nr:hypothetical protein LWI28_015068 [Acer negundo]